MTKPHIAILHYTALPIIGGVEKVIGDHVQLLRRAGYPVTIVTGRGGDAAGLADTHVVVIPEIDSEFSEIREMAPEIDAQRVPRKFDPLVMRIRRQLRAAVSDADVLIAHNILSFHFNLPLTAALNAEIDESPRLHSVAWCHDISRHVNPASGAEQRHGYPWDLLRTPNSRLEYVAVSASRQRRLAEILGIEQVRVRVIPNGVSSELLLGLGDVARGAVSEFGLEDADLIVLMPVRVTQAKNIEYALDVIAEIKKLGLEPRLVVTGPPDPHQDSSQAYYRELLDLRRRLDVERQVIFMYEGLSGFPGPLTLSPATVAEFYRLTDIVFMPSHREGFGLPVLEGGLLHKAVFATLVPAVEEVGADMVYLVRQDETTAEVARRMRDWAAQDVEQRLRQRVRQEYTWRSIFERKIVPLITEVAGRRIDGG